MEVVNTRAALLSNYEVLTLLRELEIDHLSRARTAVRIKKEEEAAGRPTGSESFVGEASENMRTIEIEAIQYLSAVYLPTRRQSPEGVINLTKSLSPFELTKAEKLQVVNLAPTLPVELYVIVEELEDRLGERMNEILTHVQLSLSADPVNGPTTEAREDDADGTYVMEDECMQETDVYHEDIIFDDSGEGAGIEGDLDVEED